MNDTKKTIMCFVGGLILCISVLLPLVEIGVMLPVIWRTFIEPLRKQLIEKTVMKTKTWVLLTLAFFIVAIGSASELAKLNIVQVEAKKALVDFNIPDATPLEITLSARNGEIVYYKKTKERYTEYKKVIDFSELRDGKYCICINYGNQSLNRTLNVDDGQIAVGPVQRLYEPYFCLKGKKLNVSFLNCICEPVYVNIYRNGEHVSGHNLGKGLTVQKCLDLSRLRSGEYEIVLTDRFKDHKFTAQL